MNQLTGILVLRYLALKYFLTALILAFVGDRFYVNVLKGSQSIDDSLSKAGAYGVYVLIFIAAMTALCFLLYFAVFKRVVSKAYFPFVTVLLVDFLIHWKLFSPASLIPPTIGLIIGILLSLLTAFRTSIWATP